MRICTHVHFARDFRVTEHGFRVEKLRILLIQNPFERQVVFKMAGKEHHHTQRTGKQKVPLEKKRNKPGVHRSIGTLHFYKEQVHFVTYDNE